MRAGEVRAVRELTNRVQAQVCLGADTRHGYAIIQIEASSPEVMEALAALKAALKNETRTLVGDVLAGQKAWDHQKEQP